MKKINHYFNSLLFIALTLFSFNSFAEHSKEFGDYIVHYNAFRSDTISPEIAKQYGLARAKNRVLINIAVLKKVADTTGTATPATITGHASNLTGQLKQLVFKEVTEGKAVYYLAETKVSNGEFLKFNIKVVPKGVDKVARLQFDKRFFTD